MRRQQLLQQMAGLSLAALLLAGCVGVQVAPTATLSPIPLTPTPVSPTPTPALTLVSKRALFIIYELFVDDEYGNPRAILEDKGAIVHVASSSLGTVKGIHGMEVQPDMLLSNVRAADFDAIIFVGGFLDSNDAEAHHIAREAVAQRKILAGIYTGMTILAKAGVLKGKRATCSEFSEAEVAGAICTDTSVIRDGLIITASGWASRPFGEAIAAALEE